MRTGLPALFCACILLIHVLVYAGEIPGMLSQAPPFIERDFEINFSNDFLGRGGSVDDFRTQQIILSARIADRWLAILDHSILTLDDTLDGNRLDQLSGSLGYEIIGVKTADRRSRLLAGAGFRASGEYAGERMQNGFHRLIMSGVTPLDYVETSRTDGTFWIDGEYHRVLKPATANGYLASWDRGYWVRGNSLLTTDGQWDVALGAYAVASRESLAFWFGLRNDWRNGYDRDVVQVATAEAEQDLSVVLGFRFGALMLETVQQTRNKASYGQLKFVSTGRKEFPEDFNWPRSNFEFAFVLPDVQVQLAAKFDSSIFASANSLWRESWLVESKFGEPQLPENNSLFIRSRQLTAGLEWERRISERVPWISAYGAISGGYRTEQLIGDNALAGQQSESIGRVVINTAAGLRFNAANLGSNWWYRLQLGVVAWTPLSDASVMLDGQTYGIQKTALGISLGMTFDYR